MAIVKQQVSVTRGYQAKAHQVKEGHPSLLRRALTSLHAGARELRALMVEEIVCATMDTARLLNYLRYELGFRTRTRVQPVRHDLGQFVHEHERMYDMGTFNTEKVRVLAKR